MKRFAFFVFLSAFAAARLVPAEDEHAQQRAKQNAAAARYAEHHQVPARVVNYPRNVHHSAQVNANVNAARLQGLRPPTVNHAWHSTPNVAVTNANAVAANAARRNWRDRSNWDGNGNWQNNHVDANPRTDSSVSGNDWQNRTGNNGEWNRHHSGNSFNWDRQRRNRSWWRSHYTRFALFGGGYYYWNSGYWYPAYGYDPYYSTYSYDAPIYAYNDQDPGQVIADVQAALQRRGYDAGGVDGSYGPMTRRALVYYQRDNGLPVTGQIDEATLDSLGLQ